MDYTEAQILDLFEKSSQDVQDTLSSQELLDLLAELRNTHGLHVDAVGKIAELIRNLLLGIIGPTDYYNELVQTGLTPDVAQRIVSSTNDQIFIPLRNRMQGKDQIDVSGTTPKPSQARQPLAPAVRQPVPEVPQRQPIARPVATPLHIEPAPQTQVITTAGAWPGAPAGNWQPAAAVHVYVPGPAPMHPQSSPYTVVHPEQPTQAPAPIPTAPPAQPAFNAPQPEPTVHTVRPIPAPPANLPGAPAEKPIEREYVADPYREPM
jgi:hypothetical protein